MAQVYTVTEKTSIVLISTLQSPNTIVLLSSISYPGHLVGIRDITGDPSISARPIVVSTTSGVRFYDYSFSTLITQPNGYLSLSSKDPQTWQLLNTIGFQNTLPAAYLSSLYISYGFVSLFSSGNEYVDTQQVSSISVEKNILVEGNTLIQGKIQVMGNADFFSSISIRDDVYSYQNTDVRKDIYISSTLFVKDALQVFSSISTSQSITFQNSIQVGKSVYADSILLPRLISINTITMKTIDSSGGALVAQNVSTQRNVFIENQLNVQGESYLSSIDNTIYSTFMNSYVQIIGDVYTKNAFIKEDVLIQDTFNSLNLYLHDSLSTTGSIAVNQSTLSQKGLVLQKNIGVGNSTITNNLYVDGNAKLLSVKVLNNIIAANDVIVHGQNEYLNIYGDLLVEGNAIVYNNIQVNNKTSISSSVSTIGLLGLIEVGGNVFNTGSMTVLENTNVKGNVYAISTFEILNEKSLSTTFLSSIQGNIQIQGNLIVKGDASAEVLGSPLSLSISTLNLERTLYINSKGFLPIIESDSFQGKINIGETAGNEEIRVEGNSFVQNTLSQLSSSAVEPRKYYANQTYVSSFLMKNSISSMIVGSNNFVQTYETKYGYIVVGSNTESPGRNLIWYSDDLQTWFPSMVPYTNGEVNSVATNGAGFWVAACTDYGISDGTLKWSDGGFFWYNSVGIGFSFIAYDVVYGDGTWVAVGEDVNNIKYSRDGQRWFNASIGSFAVSGRAVFYSEFQRIFHAVGDDGANFGYRYSFDGDVWYSKPNPPGFTLPFVGRSFTLRDNTTQGFLGSETDVLLTTTGGSTFSYLASPPPNPRLSFVYAQDKWVSAGCNTPYPLASISISSNSLGSTWVDISNASISGLTGTYSEVVYDSITSNFIAVGSMDSPSDFVFATSPTGESWTRKQIFSGKANGIAMGLVNMPLQKNLFTVNLETLFTKGISSIEMNVSTIEASSFSGVFIGEALALSNVANFESFIKTSTLKTTIANVINISTIQNPPNRMLASTLDIQTTLNLGEKTFASSVSLVFLGGRTNPNSNIKYSVELEDWAGTGPTFQVGCAQIAGNGKSAINEIFFVAVGADSRKLYTIQWSSNGVNWNPILSGGFSGSGGIYGFSVAYAPKINAPNGRWFATGYDSNFGLQYSDDGKNWIGVPQTPNYGIGYLYTLPDEAVILRIIINQGPRYSTDGFNWFPSQITGYPDFLEGPNEFTVGEWGDPPRKTFVGIISEFQYYLAIGGGTPTGSIFNAVQVNVFGTFISGAIGYGSGNWVSVDFDYIRYSLDGLNWYPANFSFTGDSPSFITVSYNSNKNIWLAGAQSEDAINTLWYSLDTINWQPYPSGGFVNQVQTPGFGYGVFFISGRPYLTGRGNYRYRLSIDTPAPILLRYFPEASVFFTNTTNLSFNYYRENFSTIIRKGYIDNNLSAFPIIVLVGDGLVPSKTIAVANDTFTTFRSAITGGFIEGYDVSRTNETLANPFFDTGLWVACGISEVVFNTIQYSADGLNWFGMNSNTFSVEPPVREGARGIFIFDPERHSPNTPGTPCNGLAVVVGKDSDSLRTIGYRLDASNWLPSESANIFQRGFNVQGNGVTAAYVNYLTPNILGFMAVGEDTNQRYTIQWSSNEGKYWNPITAGGFNVAGYGIATNHTGSESNLIVVAVGYDTDSNKTIQVCTNPTFNGEGMIFTNVGVVNPFTKAGYGIGYNSDIGWWIAVGEDLDGITKNTIKKSRDGFVWTNYSTRDNYYLDDDFTSYTNTAQINTIYAQEGSSNSTLPVLSFSNLAFFEEENLRRIDKAVIRTTTSNINFQEVLRITSTQQVIVNSNKPYDDPFGRKTVLTVNGGISVSSLVYNVSPTNLRQSQYISSVVVSTLINEKSMSLDTLRMPGVSIQDRNNDNFISTSVQIMWDYVGYSRSTRVTNINDVLYLSADLNGLAFPEDPYNFTSYDYVNIFQPTTIEGILNYESLTVNGTTFVSTLSTQYLEARGSFKLEETATTPDYFKSDYMTITTINDGRISNKMIVEPSTLRLNNVFTLNISSQNFGYLTNNPQFTFDVRGKGFFETLSSPTVVSKLLYLTFFSA